MSAFRDDDDMERSVSPAHITITPGTPMQGAQADSESDTSEDSPEQQPNRVKLTELFRSPSPSEAERKSDDGMELDTPAVSGGPSVPQQLARTPGSGITPENTMLSVDAAQTGLLTTPLNATAMQADSPLTPLTPEILKAYTANFVPNVTLAKRTFFSIEDIADFDWMDARDLAKSVAKVILPWANHGLIRFRGEDDDTLWLDAALKATSTLSIPQAFEDLKSLVENETDEFGNRRDPRTWADQASRLALFLGQFTLGYDQSVNVPGSYNAAGLAQNGLFFDDTILQAVGLPQADIDQMEEASVGFTGPGGNRQYPTKWHQKLRDAGGITLNQARKALLYRFPQLVRQIGVSAGILPPKSERPAHMDSTPHWKPLKDAYEKVMLGNLAEAYLERGLLPEDYRRWNITWQELSAGDKEAFTAVIRAEPGLVSIMDDEQNKFWEHTSLIFQGWLWPFGTMIYDRCVLKFEKAVEDDNMDQIKKWAEADTSHFIAAPSKSEAEKSVQGWYSKMNTALTGTIRRPDDDDADLIAATFSRDLYNLEHAAFQASTVLPRFFDLRGEEVVIGEDSQQATQILVESLHKDLNKRFFQPAMKTTEDVVIPNETPIYIEQDKRSEELTPYRLGSKEFGGKTHTVGTGVFRLEQFPPADPVHDVEIDRVRAPASSQDKAIFDTVEQSEVKFSEVLAVLHDSFKEDLKTLSTPAAQNKIKTILSLFQEHNHLWSQSARNITGNGGSDYGGTAAVLDARTMLRRLLSGAKDEGIFKLAWVEAVGKLYDRILAIATVIKHPGLWMLSIENLMNAIPDGPTGGQAGLLLSEMLLVMRHGLFTAIVQSEGHRSKDVRKSDGEDVYYSVICRSIGFVVKAQRGLCSRSECRRSLFVDRSTAPCNTIKNDRQLTTSSLFTRMGHRTLVIKGNMGVPPAVLRSSRGPCPWLYLPMRLPKATLAALMRMAKFEHRFDKYQRDRTYSGLAILAHLSAGVGEDMDVEEEMEE